MFKIRKIILVVVILMLVTPLMAARKIVVPRDFPTIHAGLGEADEGDTVFVLNGVYRENIALVDNVVLMGEDMTKTVIDGGRKGPVVLGADGAVISGFKIYNGTTGILCKNTRPTIERNLIVDNKGTGIHALIALPDINNNVIYRNEWTGIFLEGVRGTRTSIEHNVILENGYSGIFAAGYTEILVQSNILTKNKQYGIYIGPNSRKSRIIYNNIWQNRKAFNADAVVDKQTNISQNPMFISQGHPEYNYFVKSVSACKGQGENGSDIGLITKQMVSSLSTDRDGDGITDDIDQCPDVAEDPDGFQDQDGCPDYDNDNDGIYDNQDKCPNDPEDRDGHNDMDGCPDNDNDKDGIPDVVDNCPTKPETKNGYKDSDGCPDERPKEIKGTFVLRGVNFKTASAELLEESYYVLENVYNSLEAFPHVRVEIAGHTDSQGGAQYNMALSYDRAKSVRDYLVMRGLEPNRVIARGYGESRPIADNSTAEGRAQNRRVEVVPLR